MKIMITGPQGCGKTTQAHIIADKLGIGFIGAGDLLRNLAQEDSDQGRSIKEDLEKGSLVDDKVIAELFQKQMSLPESEKGFVADGYPRTLSQLDNFDPNYEKIFYLKISDEIVEERLLKRGREDDTLKLIHERLSWYHEQTKPLLDYYQKIDKLIVIDGEQPIEKVTEDIMNEIKNI